MLAVIRGPRRGMAGDRGEEGLVATAEGYSGVPSPHVSKSGHQNDTAHGRCGLQAPQVLGQPHSTLVKGTEGHQGKGLPLVKSQKK